MHKKILKIALLIIIVILCVSCGRLKTANDDQTMSTDTLKEVHTELVETTEELVETTEELVETTEELVETTEELVETTEESALETSSDIEMLIDFECKPLETTMWSTTSLNIRKGPDTQYEKLGTYNYMDAVKVLGKCANNWYKVDYNGNVGYVSGDYLTDVKENITSNKVELPINYSDETATIEITKEWYENAYCYAAHITFTDYDRLGTTCGKGVYGGKETTSSAASRVGAMFAVNGCYSAPELDYAVARDGVVYNDKDCYSPGVYNSNTGELLSAWETGGADGYKGVQLSTLVNEGKVTDTFCFGPPILMNGEIKQSNDTSRAQRTFIGTNGNAGDIWIVVSDGRKNDGESSGLTYTEMANYLLSKGCILGIPLDGGGSSTMVWNGKVLNANKDQRKVVDFIYFK